MSDPNDTSKKNELDPSLPSGDASASSNPTNAMPPLDGDQTDPEMNAMGDEPITFGDDDGNEKTTAISLEELGIVAPAQEKAADEEGEPEPEPTMAMPGPIAIPQGLTDGSSEPPAGEEDEREPDPTMAMLGPIIPSPDANAASGRHDEPLLDESERTMAMPSPSSSVEIDPSLEDDPLPNSGPSDDHEVDHANIQPPPLPQETGEDESIDIDHPSPPPRPVSASVPDPAGNKPAPPPTTQASNVTVANSPYHRTTPPVPEPQKAPPQPVRAQSEPSFSGSDAAEGRTMMFDVSMLREAAGEEPQGVLTVLQGPDEGKEYFLRGPTVVVGRSLECDLTLNDASISRKHFRIERRDSEYVIADLGSGNGTLVHGAPITRCPLKEAATISIGTTVLRFNLVGSQERAGGAAVASASASGSGSSITMWLVTIVVLLVAAVGTTMAGFHYGWWETSGGSGSPSDPSDDENIEEALDELYELLADKDLDSAETLLEELQGQFEDDERLEDISAILEDAEDHIETINREKKRLDTKDPTINLFQSVLRNLETISTDSPYYSDATSLSDRARNDLVEILKEQAYGLQTQGKYSEALEKIDQVLKYKPDDSEAEYHRDQLKVSAEQKAKAPVSPGVDADVAVTTATATTNKPTPTKKGAPKISKNKAKDSSTTASAKPQPNMRAGFRYYKSGQFDGAARHFERIANDRQYTKRDRRRSADLAKSIRSFAPKYTNGKQAISSMRDAAATPLLERALALDKKVNSTYKSEIRRMLSNAFTNRSTQAFNKQQHQLASSHARKALAYYSGQAKARMILEKVQSLAENNLAKARDAMNRGDQASAKKLLNKAKSMGGKGSRVYKKAKRLLNQIRAEEALEDDD